MSRDLIQEWNNDPPPTERFLEKLQAYLDAVESADSSVRLDRFDEMIDAITTPQDLGQFLLEMSETIHCESIENRTMDRYWDALGGVIVVDGPDLDRASNPWRHFAHMLYKALYYE